jgi:hypothetical protein
MNARSSFQPLLFKGNRKKGKDNLRVKYNFKKKKGKRGKKKKKKKKKKPMKYPNGIPNIQTKIKRKPPVQSKMRREERIVIRMISLWHTNTHLAYPIRMKSQYKTPSL